LRSDYDYIITGAGCSGLSLLMHMLQHPELKSKSILIVDKAPKDQNDRTWCFWEKETGLFESIVHHRWGKLNFYSSSVDKQMNINPYEYKMIRGINFYRYCFAEISKYSNIDVAFGEVQSIGNDGAKAFIQFNNQTITSDVLFNSILFNKLEPQKGKFFLLQHFKGLVIKTPKPTFDPSTATLMDFRTSQQHGATFFYVMPTSPTEALVEYTLFTPALLNQEEYDAALKQYILKQLHISNYEVLHEEFGIIPMTNNMFEQQQGNIINIGTAGGQVKASSGYAFKFIQKQSKKIAASLAKGEKVQLTSSKKFNYYDSVFLNVLFNNPQKGAEIFSKIFANNSPETIFRFLDNESSLLGDLKIITPLTSTAFIKAGIQELVK
jgi:lycopene beta-cyclase